ncbi:MAG: transglutaminaseTgpA domain-containing protein [Thermodesulfovibrionales bacterium]
MRKDGKIKIRDVVTLISYVAAITGFIPVLRYVHAAYIILFLVLFSVSIYFEKRGSFLPRWLLNLLSLLVVLVAFFRVDRDNLVTTAVETLLILEGIKLMEDKKPRDHLQIYIISVFLIAGSALLTLNISFVLYFAFFTFVFTSGIIMLTYQSESGDLVMDVKTIIKILSRSLLLPILAIPLTVLFFVILPRTSFPFLNFLNKEAAHSGFTDSVTLGKVTEIQEDNTIAFRVNMERISDDRLYWRGIVLDYFDGSSWKIGEEKEGNTMPLQGKGIRQTIYLEPYENRFLFALDKPLSVSIKKAKITEGISFILPDIVSRRIRYEAYSNPSDLIPESKVNRKRYLQLPDRDMERLKRLALKLKGKDDEETATSIMSHLKKDYSYTLKRLPISDNPVEDFLFNHRKGNCEYFASSMAIILRINGIPSRLVGGYRGGHYNDVGGYYLISQRNAHVWVEAYINGKGWLRYDPTPSVLEDLSRRRDILFKARLMLDAINYYWNAFVISYDLSKQLSLFNKVRNIKKPVIDLRIEGKRFIRYLVIFLVFITIVFFMRLVLIQIRKPIDERLVMKFMRIMKQYGYIRKDSQGLEEFVSTIKEPLLRERASAFVKEIEPYLFGHYSINKEAKEKLKRIIKDIE